MPDPAAYDSEESWMSACMSAMHDEGKPQDEAAAACASMWRDKDLPQDERKAKQTVALKKSLVTALGDAPSVDRAWSTLTVKSIDAEQRTIEGVASTPTVDRVGDIVEPMGAKFTLPIPLLHHHKSDQPVGQVIAAKATKDGITIKAQFAQIADPGTLKDRIDTAWQEVKAGLVRGLSIGFKAIDAEPLDPKDPWGGLRFNSWNWFELSLVTIPANADASITLIKSLDQGLQAASGNTETVVTDGADKAPKRPGATGKPVVNLKRTERKKMSTTQEQIAEFEAARAAKAAARTDLMDEAAKSGETLDAEQEQSYDDLDREIKAIDKHLKRLYDLEEETKKTAKPVHQVQTVEDGVHARAGVIRVRDPEMPKGIRFARMARCLGLAQGNRTEALRIAERAYASDQPTIAALKAAVDYGQVSDLAIKAAVPAAGTVDPGWAGNLVTAVTGETGVVGDFLDFLRPKTIVGKFGTNGIPSLRRVPFRTGLVSQTQGGTGYWVGEGDAKPATKVDFNRRTLTPTKCATIAVVTDELLRESSPSADELLRNSLSASLVELIDSDFIDPASGVSLARPASITNGITTVIAQGGGAYGSAENVKLDVRTLLNNFLTANHDPETGVWIMRSTTALALSMLENALGQPEFPGINRGGGTFMGFPVITSMHVPAAGSPSGDYVVFVDANSIYFADDGGIRIDMSREATVEMDTAPQGSAMSGSPSTVVAASASLTSLWAQNCVGFLAERTINWMRARETGVAVLEGVNWGEGTEP